ncbi:unnamed protein product [Paramecium primaurelia]|uniref:Uncharacterized protein n=1 Tax=Paramecium primaurelia TaxID=5886 RepID=A0A8S1KWP1_PARPR|nr:unnamed protein product [Paramecium primaurelia]
MKNQLNICQQEIVINSSNSKNKIKLLCEHEVDENDKIDVNTYKCMIKLKLKFQQCEHEVEYYCFEKDKIDNKCHFICDKLLPCGDRCKKKCYQNCLPCMNNCQGLKNLNLCEHFVESRNIDQEQQKQCNQEVKVKLDCGHTANFQCWQREKLQKSYICKQICNKQRICGHSFNQCNNYCFQQQCSPCLQQITLKLDCDHEQQIWCYQKDDYINTVCKECQNKNINNQKKNLKNQVIIDLNCGHKVQTTYDQKAAVLQSFQCLEKCIKPRICQHNQPCDKFCYQECTPCREIIEKELSCGHQAKLQCSNAKQELENYKCKQPCNKKWPCSHKYSCQKECGDHNCTPCQQEVTKQLKCAHTITEICSNLQKYKCRENCTQTNQCGHPCRKYCGEECDPCEQEISIVFASCAHEIKIPCFQKESLTKKKCQQCIEKNSCILQ